MIRNKMIVKDSFYTLILSKVPGIEDMLAKDEDEFCAAIIAVGYAAMPLVFRMVIPEEKFTIFVTENKTKFFQAISKLKL